MKSRLGKLSAVLTCSVLMSACSAVQMDTAEIRPVLKRPIVDRAEEVGLIVSAHPDDEAQMWSLLDNNPQVWPIFVFMTHGEATGACVNSVEGEGVFQNPALDLGDIAPTPWPEGNNTITCEQARIKSTLDFFSITSKSAPRIPGDLVRKRVDTLVLPDFWCAHNSDEDQCKDVDSEPLVYIDAQYRGALVFFDAGDSDLTPREVSWALNELLNKRTEWGLSWADVTLVAGNYFSDNDDCAYYPHADHKAVNIGLGQLVDLRSDLNKDMLALATCGTNPNVTRTFDVSDESSVAMFGGLDESEVGAHEAAYGWLWPDTFPFDRNGQKNLFHAHQTFTNVPEEEEPAVIKTVVPALPTIGEQESPEGFVISTPTSTPSPSLGSDASLEGSR